MIPSRAIKAMKHQEESLAHAERNPIVFDTSDGGTGKTFVAILAFAKRRRDKKRKHGPLIVLAPKSLLETAWLNDIRRFAPDMKAEVAWAENREKVFAKDLDIYITNHDAVKWLNKQKAPFWKRFENGELMVDESTAYKHHSSQRSYAVFHISKKFKFKRCATATPNPGSITDVWHQVLLLDGGQRLGNSYYKFRAACCEPVERTFGARKQTDWIDKDGAEEAVFGMLADITIRHERKNCIDLPANHLYTVEFKLPKKIRSVYDLMFRNKVIPLIKGTEARKKAKEAGEAIDLKAHSLRLRQRRRAAGSGQRAHRAGSGPVRGAQASVGVLPLG
jgi:hypothetical protein